MRKKSGRDPEEIRKKSGRIWKKIRMDPEEIRKDPEEIRKKIRKNMDDPVVTSLEAASTAITDQTVWQLLLIRLTSLSGRSCCSDQDEREENVVRSNPIAADSGRL